MVCSYLGRNGDERRRSVRVPLPHEFDQASARCRRITIHHDAREVVVGNPSPQARRDHDDDVARSERPRVLRLRLGVISVHTEYSRWNVGKVRHCHMIGCATFRRGDVFVEFYDWRRWFVVSQVSAPDDTFKGWYCDVTMPPALAIGPDGEPRLSYVDPALDLWRGADGTIALLDEEEFAAYRAQGLFIR